MMTIWKSVNIPLSKKFCISDLFPVYDANSCDKIVDPKFISTALRDQIASETARLKKQKHLKLTAKYERRKNKLLELMKSSYLLPADVGFDPAQDVQDENMHKVADHMKDLIRTVKRKVLERKELVQRVDTIQHAITNDWNIDTIRALITETRDYAEFVEPLYGVETLRYKGENVSIILNNLLSQALSKIDHAADEEQFQKNLRANLGRTRSSSRYKALAPDFESIPRQARSSLAKQGTSFEGSNAAFEWHRKDTKRIVRAACKVRDLNRTIDCYTKYFGMTLLKKFDKEKCTHAFLGFGRKDNNFALELSHHNGTESYQIGEGFGHFAIAAENVAKLVKRIKSSSCCKITFEPGRRLSSALSAAQDHDGYVFELIPKVPMDEPLCEIMFRVVNLDRSVKFYEKALGMILIRMVEEPGYKCSSAVMGYYKEFKSMVLKLSCYDGVTEYKKGNAFCQLTISTKDYQKSIHIVEQVISDLGGVLEPPDTTKKMACFLDPDGWRVALVQHEEVLKELREEEAPEQSGIEDTPVDAALKETGSIAKQPGEESTEAPHQAPSTTAPEEDDSRQPDRPS